MRPPWSRTCSRAGVPLGRDVLLPAVFAPAEVDRPPVREPCDPFRHRQHADHRVHGLGGRLVGLASLPDAGLRHRARLRLPDRGSPVPGHRRQAEQLKQANETLEQRIAARTADLQAANVSLDERGAGRSRWPTRPSPRGARSSRAPTNCDGRRPCVSAWGTTARGDRAL